MVYGTKAFAYKINKGLVKIGRSVWVVVYVFDVAQLAHRAMFKSRGQYLVSNIRKVSCSLCQAGVIFFANRH